MPSPPATPFDLVFGEIGARTFPDIQAALSRAGADPRDRDAFLMTREAVSLLRELRPEEGMGEAIDQLAALIHHAYLFWAGGGNTITLQIPELEALLAGSPQIPDQHPEPGAYYVQLPERRIWAKAVLGSAPEPLDGCFVASLPDETSLRVLGIFGLRPERFGFTVVEVTGARAPGLSRSDGSELFSPTLPGGAAAGLFSLVGGEELLELGWRTRALAAPASAEVGRWRA
jgi:hypothetical protein